MLINCVAYQNGQKLGDIASTDIHDYLRRPDCFVWVALKDPLPSEISQLAREFDLHELAVEDAQHGHQRPKLDEYGDMLFCVMKTLQLDDEGYLNEGEVDVFVGANYVLSIRNGTRKGFQNVRERCEREPHLLAHGSGAAVPWTTSQQRRPRICAGSREKIRAVAAFARTIRISGSSSQTASSTASNVSCQLRAESSRACSNRLRSVA